MTLSLRRPEPPSTFSAQDFSNEVVLVVIGGYHPEVRTRDNRMTTAMRVSIVMLTGRTAGTVYEDVMLFGAKQTSQFRDMASGDVALARIVKDNKSIRFDPGSSYDEQQAGQWIAGNAARLEQLRADTIRTFNEAVQKMREEHGQPGGHLPQSSPQFSPPSTADGNATMTSLRSPSSEPATAQETGY